VAKGGDGLWWVVVGRRKASHFGACLLVMKGKGEEVASIGLNNYKTRSFILYKLNSLTV
jgi:hypothetical protein